MPPVIRTSQVLTVSGSSAKFTNAMKLGEVHRFSADVDCWVLVGATGASAAADTADNHLYLKGQTLWLSPHDETNGFVHVIQESSGGSATLSLVEGI